MKGTVKVSHTTPKGERLVGIMMLDSEKNLSDQINQFVINNGLDPRREILFVEGVCSETKTWDQYIKA